MALLVFFWQRHYLEQNYMKIQLIIICIKDKIEFKPNEIVTKEFEPQWIAQQYKIFQRKLKIIKIIKYLFSPDIYMIKVVYEKIRVYCWALRY